MTKASPSNSPAHTQSRQETQAAHSPLVIAGRRREQATTSSRSMLVVSIPQRRERFEHGSSGMSHGELISILDEALAISRDFSTVSSPASSPKKLAARPDVPQLPPSMFHGPPSV